MSIDVMLSQEEISFRNEFKVFLEGLDLSFILRMDKEDEKEFPKDFVSALGQNNYLGIPLPKRWEEEVSTRFAPSSLKKNWAHWPSL